MTLFELGESGGQRVQSIIHHLVVDGVSWRILLEDLEQVYGQLERGEEVRLPAKSSSFQAVGGAAGGAMRGAGAGGGGRVLAGGATGPSEGAAGGQGGGAENLVGGAGRKVSALSAGGDASGCYGK